MSAYADPKELYDLLLDYAGTPLPINQVIVGRVWTLCEAERAQGLAMSPAEISRTLPWPGSLVGRALHELAGWVKDWEPHRAAVGLAACNLALGLRPCWPESQCLEPRADAPNNLQVFEHFLPLLSGKTVVVGRYPGLDAWAARNQIELSVLERQAGPNDWPDPAAEWLLPAAEWVFITGSSIANKTLPRLLSLARNAQVVLMGPSVPWLADFYHFGVDYLAGVEVADRTLLRQVIAEGGGVRLFDGAVRYRIAPLSQTAVWAWLRRRIAQTVAEKDQLNQAMEAWYAEHAPQQRFPRFAEREAVEQKLSRLDSCAHHLWARLDPHTCR